MDFIDRVLDYLETNLNLFTTFKVDILGEGENALTIKRTPSSPISRFMNNTRDDEYGFQILVKNINQGVAINTINEICVALESEINIQSNNDSFKFIKCEIYTLPVLVEKTDRGSFIYSSLFKATLFIK